MERLTVSFDDITYQKLCENKQKYNKSSLNFYINELIQIGFKVEEAATKQSNDFKEAKGQFSDLDTLIPLLEKLLSWSLESRLLTRYLLENLSDATKEKNKLAIHQAADKAKEVVGRLLQKNSE